MELFKPLLLGFALSSLLSTAFSRNLPPTDPPVSLISRIPSSAPIPEPAPATTTTTNTESLDLALDGLSNFSEWNVFDLTGFLPQIPQLDISSLHVDATIQGVCSGTDYVNECIISVLPFLHDKSFQGHVPNAIDVLQMEMHALFNKANATLELAKHVMIDPATPRPVAKVLDTCVDNYESLLEDLLDAAIAVDANDFGRLESVLSASISDVVTCSDAFAEQGGLESPMATVDEFLKKLCSNVLAISQMLNM